MGSANVLSGDAVTGRMDTESAVEAIELICARFGVRGSETDFYSGMDAYRVLVSTIISQQVTEACTRRATDALFSAYPGMGDILDAGEEGVGAVLSSVRFHRQKAEAIVGATRIIVGEHGGEVPCDVRALTALPGVGGKTAACVMRYGFGRPSVIVDTHINRVANRLGISDSNRVDATRRAMESTVPVDRWDDMDVAFITLGRTVCRPRDPDCGGCPVAHLCRFGRSR